MFFTKLFSSFAIIFVGLIESCKTSESKPSTFRAMNIPKSHNQSCCHHSALKYGEFAFRALSTP